VFIQVGGFVGKLVEFPFDTVKVRLQTQSLEQTRYTNAWDCVRKMVRNEGGPLSLYQGLSAPLVGAVLENAALFVGYELAQDWIRRWRPLDSSSAAEAASRPLTMPERCVAGGIAGIGAALVLTPVELVKCQLQVVETRGSGAHMDGPMTVIARTLRERGPLGLYRGSLSTLMREVGGGAAWFGAYEWVSAGHGALVVPAQRSDLSAPQLMLSGAMAGMAYNGALFPADVIKSRMQTDPNHTSMSQVARELYRAQGFRGFYRGLGITLLRSIPGSSTIFLVYVRFCDDHGATSAHV
ncbi:mitochondrial carrier, partial [Thamnocephalis sphaerospora]